MRILFVNGALRGDAGNTAHALARAARALADDVDRDVLTLADFRGTIADLFARLDAADGFIVGSGVYWSSWGSPLQRFIEVATEREATSTFVGKPCAAIVTLDGVGGLDVAARIVTTMNLFGCAIPPFALAVLSRAASALDGQPGFDDLWQARDLATLVENVVAHARATRDTRAATSTWQVTPLAAPRGPYPAPGALDLGSALFLEEPLQEALDGPVDEG